MSTKTARVSSSCSYFSCHETARNSAILPTIRRAKKIDQTRDFLKFSAKYGISTAIPKQCNFQVKASASPNNPSFSWQKWLLGFLLTVILPAVGYKQGLFANLKSKIYKAVETVEHVVEVVEEVAEEAEKIVEEVEEKLPEDSQLKKTLESFEDLAKKAGDEAKKAEDAVRKVKGVEEEIEKSLTKAAKDGAQKQPRSIRPHFPEMAEYAAATQKFTPRIFERIEKDAGCAFSPKSTINLMQNCDLPPPAKLFSGPDSAFLSSISKNYGIGGGRDEEQFPIYKGCAGDGKPGMLKALRFSQTRAREAERKLRAVSREKEVLSNLVVDESMRLSAYRRWVDLMELEVLMLRKQWQEEKREREEIMVVDAAARNGAQLLRSVWLLQG